METTALRPTTILIGTMVCPKNNGWTSKHLSTCCPKAFGAVKETSISGTLLLKLPKVQLKCYFPRTVSLTEESVTAENDLPPPTTQFTELKFAVQHIDAAISNIAQYNEHQADPLRFLRATLYTTMKRKGRHCTGPLKDLVERFDGDLVAARTIQERLEEHGSKEDIKLQKQIVENIERRKGVMEKLGEVLKGPE